MGEKNHLTLLSIQRDFLIRSLRLGLFERVWPLLVFIFITWRYQIMYEKLRLSDSKYLKELVMHKKFF
jgi:hypothetical protein